MLGNVSLCLSMLEFVGVCWGMLGLLVMFRGCFGVCWVCWGMLVYVMVC